MKNLLLQVSSNASSSGGNWLIVGLDRWLNGKQSFKQAFSVKNNPVVFSGNYSPSANQLSNYQIDAFKGAKHVELVAQQMIALERKWSGAGASWGDTDEFEGFWGKTYWFLTGGNINGLHYNIDGMYTGFAPSMGIAPSPNIGRIGSYLEMSKLTKGYKGAIQAHHLVETRFLKLFGLSKSETPAVVLDKVSHQIYTKRLLNELPRKIEHSPTDVINAYNRVYSVEPLWQQTIKMIVGY